MAAQKSDSQPLTAVFETKWGSNALSVEIELDNTTVADLKGRLCDVTRVLPKRYFRP
jgi:hypothetical protein